MDSGGLGQQQNIDLSKLTEQDKRELQQFVVNESQKARIQQCPFFPPLLHIPHPFSISLSLSLSHYLLGPLLFPLPAALL